MPNEAPAPDAPRIFGKYELIRRIGAGGMGEVFLARETAGSGARAIVVKKVIANLVANRHFVGRFLDEANVVVRLNHPNIVRVFEMGEVGGEYFLAMEYVQGKTVSRLARRLREARKVFPLGLALLLAERVCEGLAYAHEAKDEAGKPLQLVHRDLSPANVCMSYRGEVKIIDFGAAQSTLKEEMTAPGVVIGNLAYMSPEQARKERVGPTADVYSVGAMLWELVTGRALQHKGTPAERWHRAAYPSWDAPSRARRRVPVEVDEVVLKALRTDSRQRYGNAVAFGTALAQLRKRLKLPASDADLGRLLSMVYEKEKRLEEKALQYLLLRTSALGSDDDEQTMLVPPTALAFEHAAQQGGPLDSDESTESRAGTPSFRADVRDVHAGARVGFGISLTAEPSLALEVEGVESETVFVGQTPLPRRRTWWWWWVLAAVGTVMLMLWV